MRTIPKDLAKQWELLGSESALGAVAASRALHRAIARWQSYLVQEASAEGASWEEIGDALGTSRQAAWARFRNTLTDQGGGPEMPQESEIRQRREEGRARLRDLDAKWREEQERLRQQLSESQQRLREARKRHGHERQAAREDLRRSLSEHLARER
jgi:hypothetical protein